MFFYYFIFCLGHAETSTNKVITISMRVLLFLTLCVISCFAQIPSPPTLNGIRAAFTVGSIEDLQYPAINFGLPAIQNILGQDFGYSDLITQIYNPTKAWILYRFGVDFSGAVELLFPGSGIFYNGYASATPVAIDETYRVMASNIAVFNTLFPAKVYSVQYVIQFNATAVNSFSPRLFYNGTYGNPGNQAPSPRIPILGGYPFYNEALFWGWYVVSTYLSKELVLDTINTACNPNYEPMDKKEAMIKVLDMCPPPCFPPTPSSQVNFTFYARSYDPAVGHPYYAQPTRFLERRQMCSPDFGPGSEALDVAAAFGQPVNGSFPTFIESSWIFPMNASNVELQEMFSWNDCGCCQGCVPLTSFPPLTNPPASSSSTGTEIRPPIVEKGGNKRIDDYREKIRNIYNKKY